MNFFHVRHRSTVFSLCSVAILTRAKTRIFDVRLVAFWFLASHMAPWNPISVENVDLMIFTGLINSEWDFSAEFQFQVNKSAKQILKLCNGGWVFMWNAILKKNFFPYGKAYIPPRVIRIHYKIPSKPVPDRWMYRFCICHPFENRKF